MASKRKTLKVACVQMSATADVERNVRTAAQLTRAALEAGARLVVLPERFSAHRDDENLARDARLARKRLSVFAELARAHGAFIVAGSVPSHPRNGTFLNRSTVFGPKGIRVADYDKIHLFKATLPSGKRLDESARQRPGRRKVSFDAFGFRVGLAICYDLRFPELFLFHARRGAGVFALPAAFTAATGKLHWELLVRARAADSQSYVLAANLCGKSPARIALHGRSMIADPLGRVVARAGSKPCFITAEIAPHAVQDARGAMKLF